MSMFFWVVVCTYYLELNKNRQLGRPIEVFGWNLSGSGLSLAEAETCLF